MTYCEWLSCATRQPYRLPSEAEWERAARGGAEHAMYSWGDTPPEMIPDYARALEERARASRNSYPSNAYGLFNMGDNVHEWCTDWYDANFYSYSPERNPRGPPTLELAVPREVAPGGTTSRSPHRRAFQYSTRVQIHRLRFQSRTILYYLKFSLLAAKSEFSNAHHKRQRLQNALSGR